MRWLVSGLVLGCSFAGCGRERPAVTAAPRPTPQEVWAAIQPLAERYQMEPGFIYAIAAAESGFDPRARNGAARGLMQLTPGAWRTVSSAPYEPTVWDWRANLSAGIDHLAYLRSALHKKGKFSEPRWLAAFHYGLDYVEARDFDLGGIPVPANPIFRQLWSGNLTPVPPP